MIIRSMVFIIIVWVVNWVYYYIVNGWMNIVLVCCISFIQFMQYVFSVVYFIDSCMVFRQYFMYFVRMQMQSYVCIIMSNKLCVSISRMSQLSVFFWS